MLYYTYIIPPGLKLLDEARGLVTADYQLFLEDEWLNSLQAKYTIEINLDLVEKLKKANDLLK